MTSTTVPATTDKAMLAAIAEAEKKSKAVDALDWRSIVTAEDAFKALAELGIQVTNASDYGDGFALLDDKDKGRLVGVPFICVNARVANGSFGDFSILHIITKNNDKIILTDGSTGIHHQVQRHGRGVFVGLMCENGLTVSEYDYDVIDPKTGELTGEKRPAKTYYIDGMK